MTGHTYLQESDWSATFKEVTTKQHYQGADWSALFIAK